MNCKTSPVNARPSNFGLLRCRTTGFRPALQASPRKALRKVCSSSLDPWKTLGVSHDADEKQIKKAYRKLALDNHPDLRGSEAAARFVKIQEAYEVVTGKRRGTTADSAPQSSTAAAGWDFHDWYWKFTAGKRWDQQRKKAPRSPAAEAVRPRSTGAPEEALRAQLAGLRRKAAFRARSRPPSPAHQPGETAASTETKTEACEGSGAKDWQGNGHTAEATSSAFESSSEEAQGTCTGHDEFAVSQLAGLKRRARTRQQQQSTAVNHSAEAQTMHHTVNATTVETEEILASRTEAEFGEERSAAAAAVSEMQAAADVSAIEADMGVGGSDGEPAWRGQLRCARDFMAEVQQRSTSSNIVAATFKGLRAHLAPTIAELTHRAAAAAAAPAAGQMRGSCREGAPTFFWGAPEVNTAGDEASRECAKIGVARAGDKEGSGQQGAAQVGQHLATQLAGLKRRSAIRQYPA